MILDKVGTNVEIRYSYDYPGIGADPIAKTTSEASLVQRSSDFNQLKK